MRLIPGFPLSTIGQYFGGNAVDYYGKAGWRGHTSLDFQQSHGTPLPAFASGLVYSVINRDNPDPMRYRAVYQLVEGENGLWYEVSYGHLDEIYATPGQFVHAGTIIGTVGNTGDVWSAGRYVTREEKLAGSKAGSHLHGPQVRPLYRVKQLNGTALSDGYGVYRDAEGHYFQVAHPDNGYAGCVDPMPFFTAPESERPGDRAEVLAAQYRAKGDMKMAALMNVIVQLTRAWGQ